MRYISTRGNCPAQSFEEVVLTGLAPDGGLYIPQTLPQLSREQILAWKDLSYAELAFEIIRLFVGDAMPETDLKAIINASYESFSHDDVAPRIATCC